MTKKESNPKKPKAQKESKSLKGVGGRPTDYSPEMADRICDLVASTPYGLVKLSRLHDDLPNKTTVNVWRRRHPAFAAKYAQAKLEQADILAEDCLDIADNDDFDSKVDKDGNEVCNTEYIARSRLKVDTRKWLAAKLLPKQYGEQRKIESLEGENDALRNELMELRSQLDKKHKKDY